MQKVLLASTALVMTTGWAMADITNAGDGVGASITLEGYAAMGIIGAVIDDEDDDDDDDDSDVSFATDIDLKFIMAGQTDGGLEFGAQVDLDETDTTGRWQEPEDQGGEEIYIRGAFGALFMGDTDGALDWAMSEAAIGGSIGDIQEHTGWNGNSGLDGGLGLYDGQIARYQYSFGDFGVAVSGELGDETDGGPVLGLGVKYATAIAGIEVGFGAGIQTVSDLADAGADATIWGLSADMAMDNGIRAILNYASASYDDELRGDGDGEHYGIAVGYEAGPLLVAVNYGHFDDFIGYDNDDDDDGVGFFGGNNEGYGVLANYDLGGGAQLQGAISNNIPGEGDSFMTYSFGVAMAF